MSGTGSVLGLGSEGGIVRIEAFGTGLRGDGTVDDSVAFQAAHDAAAAAGCRELLVTGQHFVPGVRDIGQVIYRGPGQIIGNLWHRVIPLTAPPGDGSWGSDVRPALHLQQLARTNTPTVVLIGDSRSTTAANFLTPLDNTWTIMQREFRRQNPGKVFFFLNRAISGTTWQNFNSTSTIDPNPAGHPAWSFEAGMPWRAQVRNLQADVVVCAFGMNGLTEPTDLVDALSYLCGGATIPDVLLVTTPSAFTGTGDEGHSKRLRNAGIMRSLSLGRNAHAAVTNMRAAGLIDVGRAFWRQRFGWDPVSQNPRRVLTDVTGISAFPYTLPRGDGDLDLLVGVPAAAATSPGISVVLDDNSRGLILIDSRSDGRVRCRFLFQNGGGALNSAGGTTPSLATSGTWFFRVTLKGSHLRVTYSATWPDLAPTVLFDAPIFRYQDYPFAATISTARPTMDILWCNVGEAERCIPTLVEREVWGDAVSAAVTGTALPYGGNAQNHETSLAINRIQLPVFSNTNLAAEDGKAAVTQDIAAAGAVDVCAEHVRLTGPASGTYAITLPAPDAFASKWLLIEMTGTTDANSVTMALTNVVGGSASATVTFDAAGEMLLLRRANNSWLVVRERGVTLT